MFVEDWELPEKDWVLIRFPDGRTELVLRESTRTPEAWSGIPEQRAPKRPAAQDP
jgi:hypothetical protein